MCLKHPVLIINMTIVRLGRIGAHSASRDWENNNDFHSMLLHSVVELGTAPKVSWSYSDMTPVDQISRRLIKWELKPGRIHFLHSIFKPTRWYYPSKTKIIKKYIYILSKVILKDGKDDS